MRRILTADCGISPEALRLLTAYSWPGNVREMENTLERAILMHDGEALLPEHLHFASAGEEELVSVAASSIPEGRGIAFGGTGYFQLPETPFSLDALTDAIVRHALERFGGNKSKAAAFLGVSRYALLRRLNKDKE